MRERHSWNMNKKKWNSVILFRLLGFREEARNSTEKYEFEVKTQRCFSIGRKTFSQISLNKSVFKWQLSCPGICLWTPGHYTAACTTKCQVAHDNFWDIQNHLESPRGGGLKIQINHTPISPSIWRLTVVLSSLPCCCAPPPSLKAKFPRGIFLLPLKPTQKCQKEKLLQNISALCPLGRDLWTRF